MEVFFVHINIEWKEDAVVLAKGVARSEILIGNSFL